MNRRHERARRAVPFEPEPEETMTDRIIPAPCVVFTLYHGSGLSRALTRDCIKLLTEARPDVVMIHSGPRGMIADGRELARRVRDMLPGVRIWAGVGCDGWLDGVTAGTRTIDEAASWLMEAAVRMVEDGAECVVWNAERAYKDNPIAGTQLAGKVITQLRERFPHVSQGHTAYDHPTYHADDDDGDYTNDPKVIEYCWRAWCGPDLDEYPGCADFMLVQNYVAPEQPDDGRVIMAPRGALARRIVTSSKSIAKAKQLGWIVLDMPMFPYVQAHHVPFSQTVTCTAGRDIVALWAFPTRSDRDGAISARGLCEMRRRGHVGPGAVDELLEAEKEAGRYRGAIDHVFGNGAARALGLL